MQKPIKIGCLGEVMIELIAQEGDSARIGVAGDTYNTSVYIKKLCKEDEIQVSYITALGTDTFSQRILSNIKQHGIQTDHIEFRDNRMPGLYAIETDTEGERSFSYWRGEAAARTLFEEPCTIKPEAMSEFDLLYLSGISIAILPEETRNRLINYIGVFRKNGGKFVFDSNYRPRLWGDTKTAREVTMQMWSLTDIALPSLDDEMALFNDANEQAVLNRLIQAGVSHGALKRGMDGPKAIGEAVIQESFEPVTNVVDTTAAGDSFNAGFLYKHAMGEGLAQAMLSGHTLASKVIQQSGAIIEIE